MVAGEAEAGHHVSVSGDVVAGEVYASEEADQKPDPSTDDDSFSTQSESFLSNESNTAPHRWQHILENSDSENTEFFSSMESMNEQESMNARAVELKQALTEIEAVSNAGFLKVEEDLQGTKEILDQHEKILEGCMTLCQTLGDKVNLFGLRAMRALRVSGDAQVFEGEMNNQVEAMRRQIEDMLRVNAVNTDERQELMDRLQNVENALNQCRVTQVESNLAQLTFVSYLGYRVHANTVWQWLFVAYVFTCATYWYYTRQRMDPPTEPDLTTTDVTSRNSDVVVGVFAGAFTSAASYVAYAAFWFLTQG